MTIFTTWALIVAAALLAGLALVVVIRLVVAPRAGAPAASRTGVGPTEKSRKRGIRRKPDPQDKE